MPYLLTEDGVIVEDLDGVSWTDVIKQQRARASNEARVAAMYAELDAVEEDALDEWSERVSENAESPVNIHGSKELVKVVVGNDNEALTASLMERMDAMAQREAETQLALVAALQSIGLREPVVNVEAPSVNIEPPAITVEQPEITVNTPEVTVQAAPAPQVTFSPEINLPAPPENPKKTVTFVRDYSGRVEGAEIE